MAVRSPAALRRAGGVALVTTLLVVTGACSGADPGTTGEPAPTSTTPPERPAPVVTHAVIGTVTGRLSTAQQETLLARVADTVDAWIDAAYGEVSSLRTDTDKAFAMFTDGAAKRARADSSVTSNAGVARRVDDVRLVNRQLRVDVLAVDGKAVGVTARVVVAMTLAGKLERKDRVTGSLFLSHGARGWRVFGYNLDRSEV